MRLNRFLRRFRLKNYVRMKEKSEYYKEEEALFIHKSEHEPFKVQIRFGAVSDKEDEAQKIY